MSLLKYIFAPVRKHVPGYKEAMDMKIDFSNDLALLDDNSDHVAVCAVSGSKIFDNDDYVTDNTGRYYLVGAISSGKPKQAPTHNRIQRSFR